MYSMNLADRAALDTLRSTVAADVSESVWAEVEKQADEVGVLGLTGSARQLVHGLVIKHGRHNQQSHGGKGGGGDSSATGGGGSSGGKGGGGDAPAKSNLEIAADQSNAEHMAKRPLTGLTTLSLPINQSLAAEVNAAAEKGMAQITAAKGKGLQPVNEGIYVGRGDSVRLSQHGDVMSGMEITGRNRVTTHNGASAKVVGWKHIDDLAPGDVVAVANTGLRNGLRPRAFRIDERSYKNDQTSGRGFMATSIGKKGKATGKQVRLDMVDFGMEYNHPAVTIIRPTERS